MDNKLESRIARLEKLLKSKNESRELIDWDSAKAALDDAVSAVKRYEQIVEGGGGHGNRYVLGLESDVRMALRALMDHIKHYKSGSDDFEI